MRNEDSRRYVIILESNIPKDLTQFANNLWLQTRTKRKNQKEEQMKKFVSKQIFQKIKASIVSNPRDHIINCDPLRPFEGFKPLFCKDQKQTYTLTRHPSGVQILTEQSNFPYHTDMSILGRFGTRNETQQTAGAMKMLNNLLHMGDDQQTIINNFEINHLNGGGLQMNFDQESALYKVSCIPEDTEIMLDLLLRTSLQTKRFSMLDASELECEVDNMVFEEQFLKAAFDGQGVGMCGVNPQMTEGEFIEFQNKYMTPERVIISASNVPSHQYFVDLVSAQLKDYPEFLKRTFTPDHSASIYVGKDVRIEVENDITEVAIGFKSVNWMHVDMPVLQVILIMVGNSSYFSTGGPGKGMHSRATKNLLNRLSYVTGADCISNIFNDGGLFGLKLQGNSSNVNDLIDACTRELVLLTKPISPIELQRSKNILKSLMHLSLERQQDRLEEATKHIANFKAIKIEEAESMIEKVTSEDINRVVKTLIRGSRPTVTMIGQGVKKAHSFDRIAQNLLSF